jgi:hypothetical protein
MTMPAANTAVPKLGHRFVRRPFDTGILVAGVGTALTLS